MHDSMNVANKLFCPLSAETLRLWQYFVSVHVCVYVRCLVRNKQSTLTHTLTKYWQADIVCLSEGGPRIANSAKIVNLGNPSDG